MNMPKLPDNFPSDAPLLDLNSPTFADDFMKAAGIERGDEVHIVMPQFNRDDGRTIPETVSTPKFWETLHTQSKKDLTVMGLQAWDDELMLLPAEWYDDIPEGFELTCISGRKEVFKKGVTDDDRRFGALAYGIIVKELP